MPTEDGQPTRRIQLEPELRNLSPTELREKHLAVVVESFVRRIEEQLNAAHNRVRDDLKGKVEELRMHLKELLDMNLKIPTDLLAILAAGGDVLAVNFDTTGATDPRISMKADGFSYEESHRVDGRSVSLGRGHYRAILVVERKPEAKKP